MLENDGISSGIILLMLYREDDKNWPQKNKDGRQELEIRLGGEHISFEVSLRTLTCTRTNSGPCNRLRKLVPSSMLPNPRTLKDYVFSTISSKILRHWCFL
jgi:hypothetical protein